MANKKGGQREYEDGVGVIGKEGEKNSEKA